MVDDEKPFPCSSPGCSMRFANEDHLSIHKKRHMSLSIETNNGSKTPNFVADETPTPTRFIRNCEEVGLFQELNLQVNPFDEQFKRATEVTTLTASSVVPTADDVLHTPHVFPVPIESDVVSQLPPPKSANVRKNYLMPSLSTSECLTLPSPLPTPIPTPMITVTAPMESQIFINKEVTQDKTLKQSSSDNKKSSTGSTCSDSKKERLKKTNNSKIGCNSKTLLNPTTVNIMPRPVSSSASVSTVNDPLTALLLRLPDGRLVQIPAIPVPTETEATNKTTSIVAPLHPICSEQNAASLPSIRPIVSEAKMKLKQALTKTKAASQRLIVNSPSLTSDASGTDTEPLTSLDSVMDGNNSTPPNRRRRGYNSASDPDLDEEESEKRRKFLERNRAAAYRSRQKRKRWVTNLEAKMNVVNTSNRLLQNEVVSLRSEVAQLKLQLLAHKDCPVTLAMCQKIPVRTNSSDGLISMNRASSSGFTISPTTSNNALTTESSPRQIIILNAPNQNTTSLPSQGTKSIRSTPVVLHHNPILVIPRTSENAAPPSSDVGILSNHSDLAQPTSVIMSSKVSDS